MEIEKFSDLDWNSGYVLIKAVHKDDPKFDITKVLHDPIQVEFKVNGIEYPFIPILKDIFNQLTTFKLKELNETCIIKLKELLNIDIPEFLEKKENLLIQLLDLFKSKLSNDEREDLYD